MQFFPLEWGRTQFLSQVLKHSRYYIGTLMSLLSLPPSKLINFLKFPLHNKRLVPATKRRW